MKKSRKLGLQSLALVLMAFVLVAGVAFGMTGAWFTAYDNTKTDTFTFGEVTMNVGEIAITYVHEDGEAVADKENLMPGDQIKINLTSIAKTASSEDFWYKINVTVTPASGSNALSEAAVTAMEAANAGLYCTKAGVTGADTLADILVDLPADVYGNDYETDSYTIALEFRAVQLENVDATEAAALLSSTAGQGLVWSASMNGITKVA